MLTNTLISKIFKMTPQGIGKWRKENRPIIILLEKYFSKDDLNEFLIKEKVSKLDLIKKVEIDFYSNYSNFTRNTEYNFCFPTKFYWDFILRFKNDIINISHLHAKESFINLLIEHQMILLKIAKVINYPEFCIIKDCNYFINLFNTKDNLFINYVINLINSDFLQVKKVQEIGDLSGVDDYFNYKIKPYEDKNMIHIRHHEIKFINQYESYTEDLTFGSDNEKLYYNSIKEKDFFVTYEDYLTKVEEYNENGNKG